MDNKVKVVDLSISFGSMFKIVVYASLALVLFALVVAALVFIIVTLFVLVAGM